MFATSTPINPCHSITVHRTSPCDEDKGVWLWDEESKTKRKINEAQWVENDWIMTIIEEKVRLKIKDDKNCHILAYFACLIQLCVKMSCAWNNERNMNHDYFRFVCHTDYKVEHIALWDTGYSLFFRILEWFLKDHVTEDWSNDAAFSFDHRNK